ncbi:MAG: glycosyltransferase family 2 protein [Clostridia bacterium]|nr:glycosyltransferase family 2 protein [Clostridia bacterium]
MNSKKISIIIPIYKVEKYLDACVNSVLNQTYKNLEIILVDDGSPDSCPVICDKYKAIDSRIVVVHKKNGGLSDARNTGINVATGDYLAFLDGDDTIDTYAMEKLLTAAIEQSAKIVKMNMRIVYEGDIMTDSPLNQDIKGEWISNLDYIKAICTYKASCSFCDKLFHRDVFDGYRFCVGRTNEDLLLLSSILIENEYNVYSIDYYGYNYLQRNRSITKSGFGQSIRDTIYNCWELQALAKQKKEVVYPYLQMLSLYQARTFLIFMPKRYIKEKHKDYLYAMNIIKQNKKMIWRSFFSVKDKIFLTVSLFNASIIKMIVGER